jgi:S-adenosylmethionine:tRNA ribosyltransferase-isomerase
MLVDRFDFDLPESCIALRPVHPRDQARLLIIRPGEALFDRRVDQLPQALRAGDALVVNDTRVVPARLFGRRWRGAASAQFEATLTRREGDNLWRALVRPAKRLKPGERVRFGDPASSSACLLVGLDARVVELVEGQALFAFDLSGPALDETIEALGEMPLPPYIARRRPADSADRQDYQTIFAREPGAVAAPTAGLHFTPGLLQALETAGVQLLRVTLHVGAGTFMPVKTANTDDHRMQPERGSIDGETAERLNRLRAAGGRIVAVGSTCLRLLESAADGEGQVKTFAGETSIFITPGYRFRIVDALMTNFHLPRSTLMMLVAAFAGLDTIQAAYRHAIEAGYRFYSYGDACLIFRGEGSQA